MNSNHINKDEDPNRIQDSAKEIDSSSRCSDNYIQRVGKMGMVPLAVRLLGADRADWYVLPASPCRNIFYVNPCCLVCSLNFRKQIQRHKILSDSLPLCHLESMFQSLPSICLHQLTSSATNETRCNNKSRKRTQ